MISVTSSDSLAAARASFLAASMSPFFSSAAMFLTLTAMSLLTAGSGGSLGGSTATGGLLSGAIGSDTSGAHFLPANKPPENSRHRRGHASASSDRPTRPMMAVSATPVQTMRNLRVMAGLPDSSSVRGAMPFVADIVPRTLNRDADQ